MKKKYLEPVMEVYLMRLEQQVLTTSYKTSNSSMDLEIDVVEDDGSYWN